MKYIATGENIQLPKRYEKESHDVSLRVQLYMVYWNAKDAIES